MKLESCPMCGVVLDKDITHPKIETTCVDAKKGYYITYERLECPACNYRIIDNELRRTNEP